MKDDESSDEFCKTALSEVDLVFFDGRLTIFAQKIAALARVQGIPTIVEAERPRDDLDDLLAHAGRRVEFNPAVPSRRRSGTSSEARDHPRSLSLSLSLCPQIS